MKSLIQAKLQKDLKGDRKSSHKEAAEVLISCQRYFTERVDFRPASSTDTYLETLQKKYKPLNKGFEKKLLKIKMEESSNKPSQSSDNAPATNNSTILHSDVPVPRQVLFDPNKVQLEWAEIKGIGAGLVNMGNTCFLNSVLQCLTYTPPLVNYLYSGSHKKSCNIQGFCALCELNRHITRSFNSKGKALRPVFIVQNLNCIAKHFRPGRQEDAHEFLRYFVEALQKACLHGYPTKMDPYSKNTTVVHQIFGGYHRSEVKCLECARTSNTFDPLLDISLDIKGCSTLSKALERSTKPDLLEEENRYACPFCKKLTKAQKRLTIHRPPNVLTVHFKRFDYNSLFGGKISKQIEYPKSLNIRPFMSDTEGPPLWYTLYGVLVHLGFSCHSGHYYCFLKSSNNTWFSLNDSQVQQVSQSTALNQEAYLLFYRRDTSSKSDTQIPLKGQNSVGHNSNGSMPHDGGVIPPQIKIPLKPTGVVNPSTRVPPPPPPPLISDSVQPHGSLQAPPPPPLKPHPQTVNKVIMYNSSASYPSAPPPPPPLPPPTFVSQAPSINSSTVPFPQSVQTLPSATPTATPTNDTINRNEDAAKPQSPVRESFELRKTDGPIKSTTPAAPTKTSLPTQPSKPAIMKPMFMPRSVVKKPLKSNISSLDSSKSVVQKDVEGGKCPLVAMVTPQPQSFVKPVARVPPSPQTKAVAIEEEIQSQKFTGSGKIQAKGSGVEGSYDPKSDENIEEPRESFGPSLPPPDSLQGLGQRNEKVKVVFKKKARQNHHLSTNNREQSDDEQKDRKNSPSERKKNKRKHHHTEDKHYRHSKKRKHRHREATPTSSDYSDDERARHKKNKKDRRHHKTPPTDSDSDYSSDQYEHRKYSDKSRDFRSHDARSHEVRSRDKSHKHRSVTPEGKHHKSHKVTEIHYNSTKRRKGYKHDSNTELEDHHRTGGVSDYLEGRNIDVHTWHGDKSSRDLTTRDDGPCRKGGRDDWDEELDRGKTKKVKRRDRDDSDQWSSKTNPFQNHHKSHKSKYGRSDYSRGYGHRSK